MAPLVPLDTAPEGEEPSADEDDLGSESEQDHDDVFVHLGGAPAEHLGVVLRSLPSLLLRPAIA